MSQWSVLGRVMLTRDVRNVRFLGVSPNVPQKPLL